MKTTGEWIPQQIGDWKGSGSYWILRNSVTQFEFEDFNGTVRFNSFQDAKRKADSLREQQ